MHQIFQGNCGGAEIPDVLNWYHLIYLGADNMAYEGSPEEALWNESMAGRRVGAAGVEELIMAVVALEPGYEGQVLDAVETSDRTNWCPSTGRST